jgi:hypothetical protein
VGLQEGGAGHEEGKKMAASAPTCSKCGAVLSGYGWSEELNFMVHFCPQCKAKGETGRLETKKVPVQMEVMDEAA